jgi:hypothetical protein
VLPVLDQWYLVVAIVVDPGRPQLAVHVGDAAEDVAATAGSGAVLIVHVPSVPSRTRELL